MLIQPTVLAQRLGVPRPQLAQRQVHEPPPFRRTGPDQKQILRRKKHGMQHVGQGGAVFGGHTVNGHFPPLSAEEAYVRHKLPLPGKDISQQRGLLHIKADQLLVSVGAGTFSTAKIYDGLQQICFSLGVLSVNNVAAGVERQRLRAVVPPALQVQGVNSHTSPSASAR